MRLLNTTLLHELPLQSADQDAQHLALTCGTQSISYEQLGTRIEAFADCFLALSLDRSDRIAVYLEKRFEMVSACFGATAAGGVFVPINPLLKPDQVTYILRDCNVAILVTSSQRLSLLQEVLTACSDLRHVILVGDATHSSATGNYTVHPWTEGRDMRARIRHRVIDSDMAAILYTSGSTGQPKGVVLSHRNMVIGAKSVASYLDNHADDTLLAALPLSFDAGFSQLTTAFHVGARVVLLNYLLINDLINTLMSERVTGLTAVPPLYVQLSKVDWPQSIAAHLRYFANTGGRMPREILAKLRARLPDTKVFLMYGLTEAFRATYLSPEEVDHRPDSIGKAIPNTEVLVLREDGTRCAPNEPGELVQRGALVALGYWNDAERTAERFKPLPAAFTGGAAGIVLPEIAVFSGDTVREDEEGFLYFIGRRDEMIKTSGYRVSPSEVESVLYATGMVGEVAAIGVPHPLLGEAIVAVATANGPELTAETLLDACRKKLPLYMVPLKIAILAGMLPRNPNGKIDRKLLSHDFEQLFVSG